MYVSDTTILTRTTLSYYFSLFSGFKFSQLEMSECPRSWAHCLRCSRPHRSRSVPSAIQVHVREVRSAVILEYQRGTVSVCYGIWREAVPSYEDQFVQGKGQLVTRLSYDSCSFRLTHYLGVYQCMSSFL